jgi:uncharacterized membrane protein
MKNAPLTSNSDQKATGWERELIIRVDRWIYRMAAHWVWVVNAFLALYAGLPFAAPILLAVGWETPARVIYFLYGFLCHQIPERSFFIWGHQVGFCERCSAIYGSALIGGILFPMLRRWLRPLPLRLYMLINVPLAIDGSIQLLGLWESDPFRRALTGSLFGLSSVWLCYPYLEQGFEDIRKEIEEKLHLGHSFSE